MQIRWNGISAQIGPFIFEAYKDGNIYRWDMYYYPNPRKPAKLLEKGQSESTESARQAVIASYNEMYQQMEEIEN